jgi:hypothetical protein
MGSICSEEDTAQTIGMGSTLMHPVGGYVENFVLVGLRVAGKHDFVLQWLAGFVLFRGQAALFAVRDAVEGR